MAFWINIYDKLSAEFKANYRDVNLTGVILSKSDGSPDLQQSDGLGGAKVSLSTASTAALASQTTLASVETRVAPVPAVNIHVVATVGVAEAALAAGACVRGCLVQAELANTGIVSVSGPGVTTAIGIQLEKGDSVFIPCANCSLVSHIGTVAGDKLRVVAM